jgi:hypothetical protein
MESLPSEFISFIQRLRPLTRVEVVNGSCFLLMGILIGEAKHGTVRASVFAPAAYQPQRLSDLFGRHTLSHQALMGDCLRACSGWPTPRRPRGPMPSGLPLSSGFIAPSAWRGAPKSSKGSATSDIPYTYPLDLRIKWGAALLERQ